MRSVSYSHTGLRFSKYCLLFFDFSKKFFAQAFCFGGSGTVAIDVLYKASDF